MSVVLEYNNSMYGQYSTAFVLEYNMVLDEI